MPEWPPQNTGFFEYKKPCCACGDPNLWTTGQNNVGQLGLDDFTNRDEFELVGDKEWDFIKNGSEQAFGILPNGTLWAWGRNNNSQLGLGDTTTRDVPTQVGTDTDWAIVTTGAGSHALAIKTDGTLWAWGANGSSQLGLGDTTTRTTPVQVGSGTDWRSVSTGTAFTLAIKTDDSLWAWGLNTNGQLGLGDTTTRTTPVQVGSASWASVSCGSTEHAVGIKTAGTMWSWGINNTGRLGLGFSDGNIYSSPQQIGSASWKMVSAGSTHTEAIRSDDLLFGWGAGTNGRIGDGATSTRVSPTAIGSDTWLLVSAGASHTAGIKLVANTLWTWGSNGSGQLGLNDTTQRTSPVQVGSDADWASVVCGNVFTHALK